MTMYHHAETNRFADRADRSIPDETTLAEQFRMQVWDKRANPESSYSQHGWEKITESSPQYDEEKLTGTKYLKLDAGGTTYSWHVGDVRWDQAIDTDAQFIQQKQAKANELRSWFENHKGILVGGGVYLPVQREPRSENYASLSIQIEQNKRRQAASEPLEDFLLMDVDEELVSVPPGQMQTVLDNFMTTWKLIVQHRSTKKQEIKAATTIAQLDAITILPADPAVAGV